MSIVSLYSANKNSNVSYMTHNMEIKVRSNICISRYIATFLANVLFDATEIPCV